MFKPAIGGMASRLGSLALGNSEVHIREYREYMEGSDYLGGYYQKFVFKRFEREMKATEESMLKLQKLFLL